MDDESQVEGGPEGLSAEASAQVAGNGRAGDGDGKGVVSKDAGDGGAVDFERMIAFPAAYLKTQEYVVNFLNGD